MTNRRQQRALCTILIAAFFASALVSCAGTPGTTTTPAPETLTPEQRELMELEAIYRLMEQGDFAAAEPRLAALAAANPLNRDYPTLRAGALLAMGRVDEARQAVKAELAAAPDNMNALFALAEIERVAGDPKAQKAALDAILKLDPKNPDALASTGDIAYDAKSYKAAETSYRAALASDAAHLQALLGLARVQFRRDELDASMATLALAVAAAPDDPLVYLDRSRVLYQLGRYADCEKDLSLAIKLDPSSAWNYLERGRLYMDIGRDAEALADFTASIDLDPEYFLPYVYRAGIHELASRDLEAIADYRMVTKLYPDYWYALESTGVLAYRLGLWREAYESFAQAATRSVGGGEYLIAAAVSLMRAGDIKAARDYAGKNLAKIDREKFPSQWLMLRLVYDQGDMASELEIRISAEKILDLKAAMLFYLGSYWLGRGKPDLGATYLRLAVEVDRPGTLERRMAEADLARLGGK